MEYYEKLLKEKPDVPVYHYTSQEGLMGIINNRCLWATKIQYLNDELEFKYATGLLLMRLRHLKDSSTPNKNKYIDNLCNTVLNFERIHVFVFSLSENGDLLSQWRGYCPQDNGYSIGFEYACLEKPIRNQNFVLIRCVYDTAEQELIINQFIQEHPIPSEKLVPPINQQIPIAFNFANDFSIIAPVLKHPSFSEEKEWRLI